MARLWIGLGFVSLFGFFVASAPPSSRPHVHESYAQNPPLAHTGGFDEPTCHTCHFDQPLNAESGTLTLKGLSGTYASNQTYQLTLQLTRSDMGRGGFQLAVRDTTGRQAGSLEAISGRVTLSTVDSTGMQYAHHTLAGTELTAPDTLRWHLRWHAPEEAREVVVHVTANAANYDASEFGDFVYTTQQQSNASEAKE